MYYKTVKVVARSNTTTTTTTNLTDIGKQEEEDDSMEVDDVATGSYSDGSDGGDGNNWRMTAKYFNIMGVYNADGYRLWYDEEEDRMYRYNDSDTSASPLIQEVSRDNYNVPMARVLPIPQQDRRRRPTPP